MTSAKTTNELKPYFDLSDAQRDPFTVAGLTLITLNIYAFYWWYETNRQLVRLGKEVGSTELGDSPVKSLLAVTLGILLIVPAIASLLGTCRRIKKAEQLVGVHNETFFERHFVVAEGVALCIAFPPFGLMYLQTSLNRIWAATASRTEIEPTTAQA